MESDSKNLDLIETWVKSLEYDQLLRVYENLVVEDDSDETDLEEYV